MLKEILFIGLLFLYKTSICQDVTVTQSIPSSAIPGNDMVVEITINKGTLTGFMKYFQEVPEGFTATDIDSKSGSFTFAENGIKIVWLSPPSDASFVISYKINIPASATGNKSFSGKISYILENERKAFEIEPSTVSFGSADVADIKPALSSPDPLKEIPKTETSKTEMPTPTKVPATATVQNIGKTYRVQIGAYNLNPAISNVLEISKIVLDNGMTKYFSGNFTSYDEAVKRKAEVTSKGFPGAFVVQFQDGKILK